ncbi:MAG: transcriptional regulator [Acidobacteria bacterium]|nr:MAG: transcriptional regulator [Acidobacteriota bacterium]
MPKSHSDPFLRKLGGRIKELRAERKISQEALAHECRIDRSYMSGIERGVRNITVLRLVNIAIALRVPPQKLLEFR